MLSSKAPRTSIFLSFPWIAETCCFRARREFDVIDDEQPETLDPVPPLVSDYTVTETVIYSGLVRPLAFEFSPVDSTKMYVATKPGQVRLFDTVSQTQTAIALDIREQVNAGGDRGLLDIALHPDFVSNPYLYAFYVVDPPETV